MKTQNTLKNQTIWTERAKIPNFKFTTEIWEKKHYPPPNQLVDERHVEGKQITLCS